MYRIFYFSGTDNTKLMAEGIYGEMLRLGLEVDLRDIVEVSKGFDGALAENQLMIGKDDVVVIGFPIHAFSMPDIVEDFIRKLPRGRGRKAVVFQTAADPTVANLSGLVHGRDYLKMKGYKVIYERGFIMGCNFFYPISKGLVKKLYYRNLELMKDMVEDLKKGQERHVEVGRMTTELALVFHYFEENWGARFMGREIYANSQCTSCGKCIRSCPKGNIEFQDGEIIFGKACMWCMKCFTICPADAVVQGYAPKIKIQGGYHIHDIIHDSGIDYENYQLQGEFEERFKDYFTIN